MRHLFSTPIESKLNASREGYTIHEKFRVDDLGTYPEIINAAYQYRKDTGTMCDYPCWIAEAGMVRINPDKMLDYYKHAILMP